MRFLKWFFCGITVVYGIAFSSSIIPTDVVSGEITNDQHPFADRINAFLKNQAIDSPDFIPTGLVRSDYLKTIERLARAMLKYRDNRGRIIDPVRKREFQYSTPCFAHAVSVLCGSGYSDDEELLQAGIDAMNVSIAHMLNDDVPDGHGDFFTVPLMLAFQNFRTVVSSSQTSKWRTDLSRINPSAVYGNCAPNWIGINMTGEFFRYLEEMTSISYVEERIHYQITRMGKAGLYQDSDRPETTTVADRDGNSFAYDNVARSMLGMVAHNGYDGRYSEELNVRLWRGAWTGLLYQSSFGEVPTGNRSSHHFWNEAAAALNYEIWATHYAREGKTAEAGAFKRAAMLSLATVNSWLRPDGSGYVTKARYPIEDTWGFMAYSSHTQYNMWCASALAACWQFCDSTIEELPAPCDIGGFVVPVLPGFKKIFANAGGTYVEFDVRGDHSHNPTGLIRVHLKGSYPQLGPSDGAVGQYDRNAQYHPLYPDSDPANLDNLSIGPGWRDSRDKWYPFAEMRKIPEVKILEETPERAAFRVIYVISGNEKLHETIIVEPGGVTVIDTIKGSNRNRMRIYYPVLLTDGEDETDIETDGPSLTLRLKGKGLRFAVVKPENTEIILTDYQRNHRNGKCIRAYAEINGTAAEYRLTAWPEYIPTPVSRRQRQTGNKNIHRELHLVNTRLYASSRLSGPFTIRFYSLRGQLAATVAGAMTHGSAELRKSSLPCSAGSYRVVFECNGKCTQSVYTKIP